MQHIFGHMLVSCPDSLCSRTYSWSYLIHTCVVFDVSCTLCSSCIYEKTFLSAWQQLNLTRYFFWERLTSRYLSTRVVLVFFIHCQNLVFLLRSCNIYLLLFLTCNLALPYTGHKRQRQWYNPSRPWDHIGELSRWDCKGVLHPRVAGVPIQLVRKVCLSGCKPKRTGIHAIDVIRVSPVGWANVPTMDTHCFGK
jgi:hypothetical protein